MNPINRIKEMKELHKNGNSTLKRLLGNKRQGWKEALESVQELLDKELQLLKQIAEDPKSQSIPQLELLFHRWVVFTTIKNEIKKWQEGIEK